MNFDWRTAVKTVAPMIGTALDGPLGGLAAQSVVSALGIPADSTDDQIAQAVKSATPEQLIALKKADQDFKVAMRNLDIKEDQLFGTRTATLEGTANDLKALPLLGPIVIFARGCQRPAWGFATMYLDYHVFGGTWQITPGTNRDAAFVVINLLVLGFLFGERAIKNLAPLIERLLKK